MCRSVNFRAEKSALFFGKNLAKTRQNQKSKWVYNTIKSPKNEYKEEFLVEIIQDFIKTGRINRPGARNSCTGITVHETANKNKGADALAHAKYIKTLNERTSWHYTVDDKSIYQHLPDEEKSYHTSNAHANESSIAIELCVNSDGDFEKTKENAAYLIRTLMKKHNISPENIYTHHDWTGKNCPATILSEGADKFLLRFYESDEGEKTISISELRKMGYTKIAI
ncbi:MAG: hypothetical protein E7473_09300 [Ruminococcaceae bacterium]|nr:hypothetical protein [Oscillospiraceae bacterium]